MEFSGNLQDGFEESSDNSARDKALQGRRNTGQSDEDRRTVFRL